MSYYKNRIDKILGSAPNEFEVRAYDPEIDEHLLRRIKIPLYEEDRHGNIVLNVWRLDRTQLWYDHPDANPERPNINNARVQCFALTRYKEPKGDHKYDIPKGVGTMPYFPPSLVEKYERGESIKNLILTEGYFKAQAASLHGFDVVGLSSIWHFRDAKTGKLYPDIAHLAQKCQVQNFIILHDADCRDLSDSALKEGADLFKRPNSFYQAATQAQEALSDLADTLGAKIYFSHPNKAVERKFDTVKISLAPADVLSARQSYIPFEISFSFKTLYILTNTKGLDDLLYSYVGEESSILQDLDTWNPLNNKFFSKVNISVKGGRLRNYFFLNNAEVFYAEYGTRIGSREFVFHGTTYQYKQDSGKVEVIVPADAKLYARVGTDYYKMVTVPNKYKVPETNLIPWSKTTIVEDHGKEFLKHVDKFEAFCNVPDHVDYQQIIDNCYNLYNKFDWEPEEGSIERSLHFVKHIFGEEDLEYHGKTIKSFELGLDYMQLLYQQPTQVLPVLALVSKERETGKSTFGNWLKQIFKANATFVSNDDWFNSFNSTYTSKLLIMTEEALLDKKILLEKIKSLSTADKIQENRKSKEQVERDFFGKFIFFSNNERNFIYVEKEETRFWVRKINPIPKSDMSINFKPELFGEIPAFLHFLSKRKLVTQPENRQWFAYHLTRTAALDAVMAHSIPRDERQIRDGIKEWFLDFDQDQFLLSAKLADEIFLNGRNRHNLSWIQSIFEDIMNLNRYTNEAGRQVAKRYSYPVREYVDGVLTVRWVAVVDRPYVFKRSDFVTADDEAKQAMRGDEADMLMANARQADIASNLAEVPGTAYKQEDLPF